MFSRCFAAALLVVTACVTEVDEPVDDELPLHEPVAELDSPVISEVVDRPPTEVSQQRNQRPVPGLDELATFANGEVKVEIEALLANDIDPEGGRVVFSYLGNRAGGTPVLDQGHVVFTPAPDFTGVAWFDYVVSDGQLLATGRTLVHVAPQP